MGHSDLSAPSGIPQFISGYSALRKLSRHCNIWLCREDASQRLMVWKTYNSSQQHEFERSLRALHSLNHLSFIPRLYFAFEAGGVFNQVSEYCPGLPLSQVPKERLATCAKSILPRLRQAVQAVHESGYLHGDLSPDNVLLPTDASRLWIIDWDFSERMGEQNLSTYNAARGTLGFSLIWGSKSPSLRDKDLVAVERIEEWIDGAK